MAEEFDDRGDLFEGTDDNIEELDEDQSDQEEDLESEEEEDSQEDEGDYEEDEEYEEEEVDTSSKKSLKIPKSRFDEVIKQREEARDRSAWLEQQLEKLINNQNQVKQTETSKPIKPVYDFEAAEEQYISLIIEGDVTKATKLRNEINNKQQEAFLELINGVETNATNKAKSESSQYIEGERFKIAIESMENKYPYLNFQSDSYNEEAVDTVNTLLAGYVAAGKPKTEALKLAINKVRPLYEKKVVKQSLGEKRKVIAGKKAADASKRQPIKTKTSSNSKVADLGTVDINRISEKDFSKLTAKEKSILRGD